jgi:hypothetical protein
VDTTWIYEWPAESFGPEWKPLDEFDTIQQVDLLPKLFQVTEHRARRYLHRPTGRVIATSLPDEVVRAGLVGPRLSALVAYQKGACHEWHCRRFLFYVQRFCNSWRRMCLGLRISL